MSSKDDKPDRTRESSGVLTIRLEPRLRYQIELAARVYRSTLSNVMEKCIIDGLKEVTLTSGFTLKKRGTTLESIIDALWDFSPQVRTIKLAMIAPELLTYEERKIWEVIINIPSLWSLKVKRNEFGEVLPPYDIQQLDVELIQLHWDLIEKSANDRAYLQHARIKFKDIATELNRNRKTAPDPAYCFWGSENVKRVK